MLEDHLRYQQLQQGHDANGHACRVAGDEPNQLRLAVAGHHGVTATNRPRTHAERTLTPDPTTRHDALSSVGDVYHHATARAGLDQQRHNHAP